MSNVLTVLDQLLAHPLVMLAAAIILISYRVAQQRIRRLPILPLGFFILYLAIRAAWLVLRDMPWASVGERWVHLAASVILAFGLIRFFFAVVVEYFLKLRGKPPLAKITRDFILLACYAIVGLILLRVQGNVNLAGLITTSAVLTAVIGLAAQNTLSGLFAGLTLQLERQFGVGDWITLGDVTGQVAGITWKSTLLITRDGETIFIPNAEITTKQIRSHSRPTPVRPARVTVGLDYETPPNNIRKTILTVLDHHPQILMTPPPEVRLKEFGDSAIVYEILFWHNDYGAEPRLKADVSNQLWYALRRANIKIPFPIRDVQFTHVERRRLEKELAITKVRMRASLDGVPVLASLSAAERDLLSQQHITAETFGDGEIIVRQGDPGDSLYIVLAGECDVLVAVGNRPPDRVATMTVGQFFGEMSLLTGAPRSATVRAKGDATLLVIDREDFRTILAGNPAITNQLAEALAKRHEELATREGKVLAEAQSAGRLVSKIKSFFGIG